MPQKPIHKAQATRIFIFRRVVEFEAHHRVAFSLVVAGVTFAILSKWLRLPVNLIASWDAFAICSLVLAWINMCFSDAKSRVLEAHLQDSSRTVLCACIVLAAVAGLVGACFLMASAKGLAGREASLNVAAAAVTVVASWTLVHTVLALHYAHLCYHLAEDSKESPPNLGVIFPNEPNPDFVDFAYFSFVIGMTFQVSDVQVISRRIRRIVLLHALLSFGYNTVIVALSLNLAASLL